MNYTLLSLSAIILAGLVDWLIGDPRWFPHPIRLLGRLVNNLEKIARRFFLSPAGLKLAGVIIVLIAAGGSGFLAYGLITSAHRLHPAAGFMTEFYICFTILAGGDLRNHVLRVKDALEKKELEKARAATAMLVSRDTDGLEEAGLSRAALESLFENSADGLVAPLFFLALGGPVAAVVYKAVNTLDSMVGYKNKKYREFGWASAKLDDLANWMPSRLTAFLIVIGNKPEAMNWKKAWTLFLRDARNHPSPNSGWLESAVAAILGVQLGGINYYEGQISKRAKIGEPVAPLNKEHIIKTNNILFRTTVLFVFVLMMGGWLYELAAAWFESAIHI